MRNISYSRDTHSHQTQPACHTAFTWLPSYASVQLDPYLYTPSSSRSIYLPLFSPSPESVYDISMAIHADYPGLTVEIYVDGKPLEEYEHEEEQEKTKTTTRYIECQSGAKFEIRTKFRPPFAPRDLSIRVHLDGVKVCSMLAEKTKILQGSYTQSRMTWKEGEKWRESGFFFSDLSVGM